MSLSFVAATTLPAVNASVGRERVSFNDDWRFEKGDAAGVAERLAYDKIKPWLLNPSLENAPDGGPFAQPVFDDSHWQSLRLPHDWAIAEPFHQEYPGETAKLPWWGTAWYRKQFEVPASDAGRQIYLDFDGAMSYASVWLNGHFVGGRPYGYSSFRMDVTRFVQPGAQNVVAVRLDNPPDSSRWYPGGGIYRNVWLVKTAAVSVGHWGVSITTPTVSESEATVDLKATITNHSETASAVTLETAIYFGKRKVAATAKESLTITSGGTAISAGLAKIANPRLWSTKSPTLYKAVTTVRQNGKVTDLVETTFGVRTVRFDAKEGFLLNGKREFMRGVCMHHDLGALGAAFNLRAAERQLEILKSMGVNALRTSHNPPAPEVLDLCDRMGILVLDEFTDTWTHAKKPNGYARLFEDWHERDLRDLVRRDRNHPSVVFWSTGNEIAEQVVKGGQEISRHLTQIVHEEDPTRLVTTGNDRPDAGFNGYQKTTDVFGYNYKPGYYRRFTDANPLIPLFGSETASTISSRGEYFFPFSDNRDLGRADFQVSSYDTSVPGWATTPDAEFHGQDENPSVFGEFVWTGFDYLGEPTPYNDDATVLLNYSDPAARAKAEAELKALGRIKVPSRSSYFGILDLCGFPKDRFYIYQARWWPELKMAHLLPHWNWPNRVGLVTPVHLYTSGDEAELFVNGKSQGRKKRGQYDYRLRWDEVVYEPGEIHAVVYKNGKRWATETVRTTGAPSKLTLTADHKVIKADGDDLSFITVTVADKDGRMVPRSKNRIRFEILGPGELVATDNGDATDHESFQSASKRAYNGLCLAIVRSKRTQKGTITVRAKADGLSVGEVQVESR